MCGLPVSLRMPLHATHHEKHAERTGQERNVREKGCTSAKERPSATDQECDSD